MARPQQLDGAFEGSARKPFTRPPTAALPKSRHVRRLVRNALVALLVVIEVAPLLWLLLSSFKTQSTSAADGSAPTARAR